MDEKNNNSTIDESTEINGTIESCNTDTIDEKFSDINRFTMGNNGNIRKNGSGTLLRAVPKSLIILGWISAALTLLISPYFVAAGITFGALANRKLSGSGNYVIIANIVLAIINIIFGIFLTVILRRMMIGY